MVSLREELNLIGCHSNGDARCTCVIAQEALAEIDRLRAEVERLEGVIIRKGAFDHIRSVFEEWGAHTPTTVTPDSLPDDGYLPGLNSTLSGAPIRSPEEQFTRRMLREAIARCLFTGLPDEREWKWYWSMPALAHVEDGEILQFFDVDLKRKTLHVTDYRECTETLWSTIPSPIWDRAWRECGMEDRT